MPSPCVTYLPIYHGFAIQANQELGYGCYLDILDWGLRLFLEMRRHQRVFFVRLDYRFPRGMVCPADNDLYENTIANLVLHAKRAEIDMRYLWVREDTSAGRCHYHLALWFDGTKVLHAFPWLLLANRLWGQTLGLPKEQGRGLVELCPAIVQDAPKEGLTLIRDFPHSPPPPRPG